jgi:hypothetical protein
MTDSSYERRLPIRIRIGVPLDGLGGRLDQMRAWLDGNCGADGWTLTPSGMRGVLNDALSIYFLDPTLARSIYFLDPTLASLRGPLVRRVQGGDSGNGNFVAAFNRWSATMPQPNDPGLRWGRL